MTSRVRRVAIVFSITFAIAVHAQAPAAPNRLQISGANGEAQLIRVNGRTYVDIEGLAQITGASLSYQGNHVVLTLPNRQEHATSGKPDGFSQNFMAAGIESIGAMREWGMTLVAAIEHGWEIRDSMNQFRDRAEEKVALAAAAAQTDDDHSGMDSLRREYENVRAWSDRLVAQRNSSSAGNLAVTPDAVQQDATFQGLVRCGRQLAQMFAGGRFQQSNACL